MPHCATLAAMTLNPPHIEHWISKLDELNTFLCVFPLPEDYRRTTTYRQFNDLVRMKERDLGLDRETYAELNQIARAGHTDLEWAFTEIGMTYDNRELLVNSYYQDLPLSFQWMDEYEPMMQAVEEYERTHPKASDEELLAVVQQFAPN